MACSTFGQMHRSIVARLACLGFPLWIPVAIDTPTHIEVRSDSHLIRGSHITVAGGAVDAPGNVWFVREAHVVRQVMHFVPAHGFALGKGLP